MQSAFRSRLGDLQTNVHSRVLGAVMGTGLVVVLVVVLDIVHRVSGPLGPTLPLLFLVPVLVASAVGGRTAGAVVAVAAALAWNWYFMLPFASLEIDGLRDLSALLIFLVVAVITGQLATTARRQADTARKDERFQAMLARTTALANSTLDFEATLPALCRATAAGFRMSSSSVYLLEGPSSIRLAATSAIGLPSTIVSLDDHPTPSGEAIMLRRPVLHGHRPARLPEPIRKLAELQKAQSVLAVPILLGKDAVGSLTLVSTQPDAFSDVEASKASQVADIIAGALRNARLYRAERDMARQLRHVEQWRTSFLRVMAHELRTPLGQIVGFTDLLDDERERLSERGQRYLANARSAAGRMQLLVNRSFDLLGLFGDDTQIDRMPIDLSGVTETVVDGARQHAIARGLSLTFQGTDNCQILGDPQRVHQVLNLLLDNALKFTPLGGAIVVVVRRNADQAEVSIQDNGPGVAEQVREQIFEGLVEEPLARHHGGLGLSLLLARRVAQLHGGELKLEPSERGSLFVLSLPAHTSTGT